MTIFSYSLPSLQALESFLMTVVMEMFWAGNMGCKCVCTHVCVCSLTSAPLPYLHCLNEDTMCMCEWGPSPLWKDVILFLSSLIIQSLTLTLLCMIILFSACKLSCCNVEGTDFICPQ